MAQSEKHFKKREAILAFLQETKVHPSAEMVYNHLKPQIPDLSLATVYRNLSMFKQQGLISGIAVVDGVERFDGNTTPHVHFICQDCASVLDLEGIEIPESLYQQAAAETGGQVNTCQVSFNGVCSPCLEVQKKGGESA